MIKFELNKFNININIFMDYIFTDLFYPLNEKESISEYNDLILFEKELDALIKRKIEEFKKGYENLEESNNNDESSIFEKILDEKYKELNEIDYPFNNYFKYFNYIDEKSLLKTLKQVDKYPVLYNVLKDNDSRNQNKYSLDKLPMFNEVLNLFELKYSNLITREKSNKIMLKDLKGEPFYNDNKELIKNFIEFFNDLQQTDEKEKMLKLSENNKLSDFFIDDDNIFGKCYKSIYNHFIEEQNKAISGLLDKKINKGIFDRDCKNKINIQSANPDEVFITNISEKFSFIQIIFNSSYRKFALSENYNDFNQIEINFELVEERMTEALLRNKKLFIEKSINCFTYKNEDLDFENKDIITSFNKKYLVEDINIDDKKFLYNFYQQNKENDNLFKTIFNDFIQLIIYLNHNKTLLNENNEKALDVKDNDKICEIVEKLGQKISNDFKVLFKGKEKLTISKITSLFEYYRNLIFERIKSQFKEYQVDLEEEKKKSVEDYFNNENHHFLITKEIFKKSIRSLIILFLNFENDKENKIKGNQNNIINYFDIGIPDLWDINIYNNIDFNKELEELKKLNIKINQILTLYDYLGDDINDDYFEDVKRAVKNEEEEKKPEKEVPNLVEEIGGNGENYEEDNPYEDDDDYKEYV